MQKPQTWKEAMRASCGFGVLGFFRSFAIEGYYSYNVQAGSPAEQRHSLSFNIGID